MSHGIILMYYGPMSQAVRLMIQSSLGLLRTGIILQLQHFLVLFSATSRYNVPLNFEFGFYLFI